MIFYFHGFSSGANSHKATILKKSLTEFRLYIPEYASHQPKEAIRYLGDYIRKNRIDSEASKIMLIGSSLGGYYAQYFASIMQDVAALVLINPALEPQKTLAAHIGIQKNIVTQENFSFTRQDYDALRLYDVSITKMVTPTLVLLDEADEIIDFQYAAKVYSKRAGDDAGRVIIYPGGNHWFQHLDQALPEVISFYQSKILS